MASADPTILRVKLPTNPFAGVKVKAPGAQRYRSEINPEWLLACAGEELRENHPQQYLAMFLCLWAGLRRKEADLLTWEQIDFAQGQLHVRRTIYFEPKTDESERTVDLAPEALDVLRTFKKASNSEFVLEGAEARPEATYDYYRCDCTWRDLNDWLRSKGVKQKKANTPCAKKADRALLPPAASKPPANISIIATFVTWPHSRQTSSFDSR